MNGPNPVWTSARKKMNQSRPRRLCDDGGGFPASGGCGSSGGAVRGSPAAASRRADSTRPADLDSCATRVILRPYVRDVSYHEACIKRLVSTALHSEGCIRGLHQATPTRPVPARRFMMPVL